MTEDPRAALRRAGLSPKRSFGQNFLVNAGVVLRIAEACVPDGERGRARVLELGAGTGALTRALAERAARVVAVERDRDLLPVLRGGVPPNVELVEGDAAAVSVAALLGPAEEGTTRVLCGNLPYQITGRLLELATVQADALDRAVFMVQLEVADRLAAAPGTKAYGALTVFVRAAFRVQRLFAVSPGSFHPPPEVTSAVVLLEPLRPRRAEETETFRGLVRAAFAARRKTLRNAWRALAPAEVLARAAEEQGVSLDARGETLDVEAFAAVAARLDHLR